MAEESVQATTVEETTETQSTSEEAPEIQESKRQNAFAFAGFLLGSWLALMIVLIVIAAVAMTIVGALLG